MLAELSATALLLSGVGARAQEQAQAPAGTTANGIPAYVDGYAEVAAAQPRPDPRRLVRAPGNEERLRQQAQDRRPLSGRNDRRQDGRRNPGRSGSPSSRPCARSRARRTAAGGGRSSRAPRRRRGSRRSASRSRAVPPATRRPSRTTSSSRGARSGGEQPLQRRVEPERVAQLLVGAANVGARGLALDRADEHVLRRVLERDELDQLRAVAGELEQLRTQRVGDEGGEALLREPVAEERREQGALELPVGLLLAARDGQDRVGAPPDRLRQRLVGGGVAGVQADDEVDVRAGVEARDVAALEAEAGGAGALRERRSRRRSRLPSGRGRRSRPRDRAAR